MFYSGIANVYCAQVDQESKGVMLQNLVLDQGHMISAKVCGIRMYAMVFWNHYRIF